MTEEIMPVEAPVPAPSRAGVRKLEGWEKTAVELGPLAAFGLGYYLSDRLAPLADGLLGQPYFAVPGRELFMALAASLPAFAIAALWSAYRVRRVPPILAVTVALVAVLGALTFALGDETFIYIKPTLVYLLLAGVLGGGLLAGRSFLRLLFDGAFTLPEAAWRALTWRFVLFYAAAAIANEVAWRTLTADCVPMQDCAGRDLWVNLKLFGFTGANFVFIAFQAPFLMRHMQDDERVA